MEQKKKQRGRAPFTDKGAAAPATMAVDARSRPGDITINIHGPVPLVQRGDHNTATVVQTFVKQEKT